MQIQKVALLGAGAVGAYFIWGLAEKLGDNFCVIAKGERKERLEREGLIINGQPYTFSVKEPTQVDGVDLLLVSSKQDGLVEALEDIKTIVDANTIVISLLNGVTSEEIIGNAIGMEHVLYSVMRIASIREGNHITFSPESTAGVFVGEKGISAPTERILALKAFFENTDIRFHFVEDIVLDMWTKYASNISQNLPQAILGVGFGAYIDSVHVNHIAACLWREVAQVANAKGIPFDHELLLFRGSNFKARFSTLQDIDAGRHTEIDMFTGEMMRMAAELNIPVPYCEYTYHLIKALEEKNDNKFDY
ncbi:MAG: ketopantoate reductase family protein [Lachnospiraceae bacterium]|nr:ketopantoate reductase family protein [Lachnospiraceae bacterium]